MPPDSLRKRTISREQRSGEGSVLEGEKKKYSGLAVSVWPTDWTQRALERSPTLRMCFIMAE